MKVKEAIRRRHRPQRRRHRDPLEPRTTIPQRHRRYFQRYLPLQ